jgi:hypothetical protein
MKRRSAKQDPFKDTLSAANDSTAEIMTNDEDEEDDTGSSDESDSSESSSDSSGDENKKQHRPHVEIRRSSLLGAPNSPQTIHNHSLNSSLSPETLGARHIIPPNNGIKSTGKYTSGLPPKPPLSAGSPTNQNASGGSRTRRRSRMFFGKLGKSPSETQPEKDLSLGEVIVEDSDTEDDDADQDESGLTNTSGKTDGGSDAKSRFQRNRLLSQSMDDLLDAVKSVHWSATGPEKVFLTPGQIREELERKIYELRFSESYRHFAFTGAIGVALIPIAFRTYLFGGSLYCRFVSLPMLHEVFTIPTYCETCTSQGLLQDIGTSLSQIFGTSIFDILGVVTSAVSTCVLAWILLGSVAGTVETFKRRYMYAKYFSKLTSSRKARRAGLPYFHLHKVDHIKVWLSLRSRRIELDRECLGPYPASDTVAHFLFMVAIFLVGVVAFRAIQNASGSPNKQGGASILSSMSDWLLFTWAFILAVFVQRIMMLASKTHERFQNTSVLLTEELNIHMRLLRKPEKKEELNACNQMLKVAAALIKELEGGKAKKGMAGTLILDPWLYSIVRVVLLSALGALSSDLFGFRVRLWKI